MDRGVDVGEIPLIGRNLAVGVQVPLAQKQVQLRLREVRVDPGEREHVERKVPSRKPRVLPLVRNGEDVPGVQVGPVPVAGHGGPLGRGRRLARVALKPVRDDVVVELLRPQEPGVGLSGNPAGLGAVDPRLGAFGRSHRVIGAPDPRVEPVRLGLPRRGHPLEVPPEGRSRPGLFRIEPKPPSPLLTRSQLQDPVDRALGPGLGWVHAARQAAYDRTVEGVLHIGRCVLPVEKERAVGFVLREEPGFRPTGPIGLEEESPQGLVIALHPAVLRQAQAGSQSLALVPAPPRPGISEPEGRQDVQPGRIRTPIRHADPDAQVIRTGLGVLDSDIEVTAAVESSGLQKLELGLDPPAPAVLLAQSLVGKLALRILVQRLQPGVGRGSIQVEVALLDVLAVVPLEAGEPEQALLEDRVVPVPKGQGEAQPAFPVANPEQSVLPPAVGPRDRLLVGEVVPALRVRGVILPHRSPLPLGQVRPPPLPVSLPAGVLSQTVEFRVRGHGCLHGSHRDANRHRSHAHLPFGDPREQAPGEKPFEGIDLLDL